MTGDTEYLRAADIARLTGMSIRTVRRWIADGTLPSTKLGGARLVARRTSNASFPLSRPAEEPDDDDGKMRLRIKINDGSSGKHRPNKRSMYGMIVFPNVTI